jgi:hypothetical protein
VKVIRSGSYVLELTSAAEERFWSKVERSDDGCWLWKAHFYNDGYGQFSFRDRPLRAHRVSWVIVNGDLPLDVQVLHRCDTPACVRPDHLFLGSHQDNMDDMKTKGRALSGDRNTSRTNPEKLARGADHGNAKLTSEQVRKLREMKKSGLTYTQMAGTFGASRSTIAAICSGRNRRFE